MRTLIVWMAAFAILLINTALASAAEINAQPFVDFAVNVGLLVLSAVVAWGIELFRTKLKLEKKSQAIMILERIADSALAAGGEKLRDFAHLPTITIENPDVAGVVGYILHQVDPETVRAAGMDETRIASWIATRLHLVETGSVAPTIPPVGVKAPLTIGKGGLT